MIFFFKQKTAYEMRISDWSSDVCSSDLAAHAVGVAVDAAPGHDVARHARGLAGRRPDHECLAPLHAADGERAAEPAAFAGQLVRVRVGHELHPREAVGLEEALAAGKAGEGGADRKSTRLNSSH